MTTWQLLALIFALLMCGDIAHSGPGPEGLMFLVVAMVLATVDAL